MVVFTCNFCGDSVNKPKADKHITIECKRKRYGFASLCCVDCLKDFDFNTYHSHTKCMTEEERYSAPGFVAKPSSGKGERKQSSWIDTVPKLLEKPTLTKLQRSVLEFINGVPNVPRKKTKFLNFMNSSMGYRNVDRPLLEVVFNLLEAEFNAAKSSSQPMPKDPVEKPSCDASQKPENTDDIENATESPKVKKKKKDKGSIEAAELTKENTKPREIPSENVNVPEDIVNGCGDEQNEDEGFTVVKKSKKKKKKEKDDDAPMEIAEPDANVEDAEMEVESASNNLSFQNDVRMIAKSRGKKKHKNKENISVDQTAVANGDRSPELANVVNTDPSCPAEEDVDRQSKKKKKKRKLEQVDAEDDIDSKRSRIETTETESNPKFSWSDVVKTLLEKSKNHEISMKRITKKVVAEYQSFYSTSESYEDITKKFHKKVKKLPFVVVSQDRVQLYVE